MDSKPIPGFPGYRVTTNGEVWSVPRKDSRGYNWPGRRLKPLLRGGYPQVHLRDSGKNRRVSIHILVLETFVGPCPSGQECRHLDGVRAHNWLKNLCWGTRAENMVDRTEHGKTYQGEQHSQAKLTEQQVRQIIYTYRTGLFSQAELARQYGVSQTAIWRIRTKRSWKHIWKGLEC